MSTPPGVITICLVGTLTCVGSAHTGAAQARPMIASRVRAKARGLIDAIMCLSRCSKTRGGRSPCQWPIDDDGERSRALLDEALVVGAGHGHGERSRRRRPQAVAHDIMEDRGARPI